jgi:hypothetical protein
MLRLAMPRPRWMVVAILVIGLTVAALDLAAPRWIEVRSGSVGIEPWADADRLIHDPDCDAFDTFGENCARRYAFRPGGLVTVWISVRNAGPVAVTLHGPAARWLDQSLDIEMLGRPVAALDGGDPYRPGGMAEIRTAPFEPVTLEPGAERLVAVEFVTTPDIAHVCTHWGAGAAQGFASTLIRWRWLAIEHETEFAFDWPIEFEAPADEECPADSRSTSR